jgi:DNA polymerase-3 subunit delta'
MPAALYGHRTAERVFLNAYNAGTLHHAWLLTGERGIGKAAFAYRAACFLLSRESHAAQGESTLDVPREHPVARQIAAGAHPSLFVIGASGAAASSAAIGVDEVRKLRAFLGLTSPGGWRAVIVDSANSLTISSANALLKAVEEPPRRTVFFLISQGAGAVMPTIRSRCVRLGLRPLNNADFRSAVVAACKAGELALPDEAMLQRLGASAAGSPGKALSLLAGNLLPLAEKVDMIFSRLPHLDQTPVNQLLQSATGAKNAENFARICDLIEESVEAKAREEARRGPSDVAKAGAWANLWHHLRDKRSELETLNLDKGAFLIGAFSDIEQVARESSLAFPA